MSEDERQMAIGEIFFIIKQSSLKVRLKYVKTILGPRGIAFVFWAVVFLCAVSVLAFYFLILK
jgi:hypothetical protein